MSKEALIQALKALPADRQVDVRDTSVWICCPEHSGGKERTPSLKITTEEGPYFSTYYCFSCGIHGNIKSLIKLLNLPGSLRTLGATAYDLYEEDEVAELTGRRRRAIPKTPTEPWPTSQPWRGINGDLLKEVGARMLLAADGRDPVLILPVAMRGREAGYINCRVFPQPGGLNYINSPGRWAKDALFPHTFCKNVLDQMDYRVLCGVEGPRDALATIQNGVPALATLGATNWSNKCAEAIRYLAPDLFLVMADPDDAGEELARKMWNSLHDTVPVKVIRLPSKIITGKRVKALDPADLSRRQLTRVLAAVDVDIERIKMPDWSSHDKEGRGCPRASVRLS